MEIVVEILADVNLHRFFFFSPAHKDAVETIVKAF